MNTENIYTAKENADGTFSILRNGVALFCPKTCYPLPVQSRIAGEMQIQVTKFTCATNCPFAELKQGHKGGGSVDLEKITVYEITCEGQSKQLELKEVIANPKLSAIKN